MTPQPAPLLRTKLTPPPPRRALLRRERLLALLDEGLEQRVTLISAGAGFGKSTLVSQWLLERMKDEGGRMNAGSDSAANASSFIPHPSSFAWLSLDAGDNDPVRFWRYVLAAVEQAVPGLGAAACALLHGPQPGTVEAVIATLLNDLQDAAQPLVLVLDDYHLIAQPDIHRSLAYAIDHLPVHAHLVLLSREDPPLPLSRWRARGHLAEVRVDQLRFTRAEAQAFLNGPLGLTLAPELAARLEVRTEGWAAGLQLAGLSLRGQADPGAFIAQFAASHRTALDYLIDEVFAQQPAHLQRFLLQTAILDCLCPALCDAVMGIESSELGIEKAEQATTLSSFSIHH